MVAVVMETRGLGAHRDDVGFHLKLNTELSISNQTAGRALIAVCLIIAMLLVGLRSGAVGAVVEQMTNLVG